MSEIRFTEEQKHVIGDRGRNLLVSAAAGSGKTAVLVERIIGLVTDADHPSSLDRLLVMTFTKAAAEGMRQKIKAALEEKTKETAAELSAAEKEGNEEKKASLTRLLNHLKVQQALLVRAHISTIDSYCQGLIRQYFQVLDIDPSFRAADDGELRLLKADITAELLEERYEEGDEAFLSLSGRFSKNASDGSLPECIAKIFSFTESRPWPDRFLEENRAALTAERDGGLRKAPWYRKFICSVLSEGKRVAGLLADELSKTDAPGGWLPYRDYLSYLLEFFEKLSDTAGDYEAIRILLCGYAPPKLSTKKCPGGTEERKASARALIEEARGYVKKTLMPSFAVPYEKMDAASRGSAADLLVLTDLVRDFRERFTEVKRDRGIVDFSDMEHLALRLLYEEKDGEMVFSALSENLSKGFDEILIDEYQDSNDVQEALLLALSAERFGRPDIFMVGDVKQSIYGFRDARPELFTGKLAAYDPYPGTIGSNSIKIELNRNFRSRKEVISSINEIFYDIMKPEIGGILYDESCALYPGRADAAESEKADPAANRTELLLMQTEGETESSYMDEELSCLMIARRIKELTEGENAPYKKKDITILLRNGKKAESLVELLGEAGIEAYFDSSKGYFSAPEVVTALSALAIIDNPRNDIPLAAVMRSPIGGFTDEELAAMRIRYGGDLPFYEVLRTAAQKEEKAAAFLSELERYRRLSKTLSVHELLYRIYIDTGYYAYVMALPGGRKRRKNLDMLLLRAENYCATSYHGLFNFNRYIEQLRKYDTDTGEAPDISGDEDVVRITTIHKSKGLEYPVTLVASMDSEFNMMDLRQNLVMDEKYGFSCDYIDEKERIRYPSLKSRLIKERMKEKLIGEELRVLYVAMTRAKDKLILAGKCKNEEKFRKDPPLIAAAASELDFLRTAQVMEKESVACRIFDKGTLLLSEKEEAASRVSQILSMLKETPEEGIYRDVCESFTGRYPYEEETLLRPKVSVSELKEEVIAETEFEFVRDLSEKKAVKGAEYGTIVHRAFEILDYFLPPESCVPDIPAVSEDLMERVRAVIRDFRKTALGREMEAAAQRGILFREQHFMTGHPACSLHPGVRSEELQILQGIIDAFIVEDEGITLIDYKTDRVETEETLLERYRLQLNLYARSLSQLLRKPVVKKIIYSTHLKKAVEVL